VWPPSGPTLTLGTSLTAATQTFEVTVAAGGADAGGHIIVALSRN